MSDQPGAVEVAAVPARARQLVEQAAAEFGVSPTEFGRMLAHVMETGEVEAAIWSLLRRHMVTVPNAVPFMDDLLAVVNAYAAGDSDKVTELRRIVLHRDSGPRGHTSPSGCGGSDGTAPELDPSGSSAAGPLPTGAEGATLSTGPSVPIRGQGSGKSHPQPVEKR